MASAASPSTVYDSNLAIGVPNLAPPATPHRTPYKDTLHRRSPTKQLRAGLKATLDYDEYNKIAGSNLTTIAEKELAGRVMKAAEELKDWCLEIEQWGWTGSFDRHYGQPENDPFEERDLASALSPSEVDNLSNRLDAIDDGLLQLDVDQLKEQILGIHQGRSRPSSSYSTSSVSNLVFYDDFQLFVTETIIYALPYLAKLKYYLRLWHMRITIFAQAPSFLNGLHFLHEILVEAWEGLRHASMPERDPDEINALEIQMQTAQSALRNKVTALASQLDRMLDILEAQDDCLPDAWIDRFEKEEKSYTEWAFEADRKLFQLRILATSETQKREAIQGARGPALRETETSAEIETSPVTRTQKDVAVNSSINDESRSPHADSLVATDNGLEPVATNESLDETGIPYTEEIVVAEAVHRPVEAVLRRASVASIESFTRDQVKSVEVPSRRNSGASFSSAKRPASRSFESSTSTSPPDGNLRRSSKATSPLASEHAAAWPEIDGISYPERPQTPITIGVPSIQRSRISSPASSIKSDHSEGFEIGEESPSVRASLNHASKPPLNMAMKKRRSSKSSDVSRNTSSIVTDQELSLLTSLPAIPASPTKMKSPTSPSLPLEEQISHILESIPARIKLKTGPAPNSPEIKFRHQRKSSTSSNVSTASDVAVRPALRSRAVTPSLSGRPTITLAPADEPGPRRGANEPEIKVYHLLSGNDKPLKLFVRRVGENGERVMVRVGGGWADLAEYLKNYADHHGTRTVSESKVELLGLGNDRVATPTPGSTGRSSALGFNRSESRADIGNRSETRLGLRTDTRSPSAAGSIGFPNIAPPAAPSSPATPADLATPSSATSNHSGLMGPAAVRKGSEISGEKKEWVDSVVEQAKKVGRKVEFGNLGKQGGTRRVFAKGPRSVSAGNIPTASGEKE